MNIDRAAQKAHLRGLMILRRIFRCEYNEFFRESAKNTRFTSKATKKGHIHRHRPAGSKLTKRHNRQAFDAQRAMEKDIEGRVAI